MNKLIMVSIAFVSGLSLTSLPVLAEGRAHQSHTNLKQRDPGVNHRQHHQGGRIRQGVRSGELTRAEVQGLKEQRREIRQQEREYKADGKLTRDERKDLHQDMNALSKDIYQEKHDAEKRPNAH